VIRFIRDVPAPAKLNLFLHVLGRREDGMHLLQSAFMLIDWCDTLHFELREDGSLSREDLGPPLPADDLVLRAARALKAASGTPLGAHIAIEKRIPSEAGLGGGSSDAATTLLALNRLWNLRWTKDQLAAIGVKLGADVPFFLGGRNAWVEGIGERLVPVQLPRARFAVVKPSEGLPTARIFADPDLNRATPAAIISGFAANPFAFGANDLQPVAQRQCPAVTQALQWLASQGMTARMTGSGSAVFALMREGPGIGQSLGQAPTDWQARECGNMEAHPLAGWASSDDSSVGG
jgi:4-diphosphocytidyl-2-C-methyl-D-erythritol kinase